MIQHQGLAIDYRPILSESKRPSPMLHTKSNIKNEPCKNQKP